MTTIGELSNVPEPQTPILSAWAQDVTERIIHRFATTAARDAAYPAAAAGAGALCVTNNTRLWVSDGTAWTDAVPTGGATVKVFSPGTPVGLSGAFTGAHDVVNSLAIPDQGRAGMLTINAMLRLDVAGGSAGWETHLYDNSTTPISRNNQHVTVAAPFTMNVSGTLAMTAGAGKTITLEVLRISGLGTGVTYADSAVNRIQATFIPT